jgi:TRAP-type transport system large permease protein
VSLMVMIRLMADRYDLPAATRRMDWPDRGRAMLGAFWPLLTPVIIMGGILGGVFTPTEAAAIAAGYAFVLGLFVIRTLTIADIPGILIRSAMTSAVVLLLIGAAMAFKTVAALAHTPELLAGAFLGLSDNPYVLLFLVNVLLFLVGMFLDAGPAIIVLGPILGPVFVELGVHPVHFAIIMVVNLTVGLLTPPMGLVLSVTSSVSGLEIVVIFLITYVPAISLTIPRLAGFIQ